MNPALAWGSLALSLLMVLAYEVHAHRSARNRPAHQARFANARMRVQWVEAMAAQPGFEIVAVQALRNSLMSATISASTAALALMASLTLGGTSLASGLGHLALADHAALGIVLGTLAVLLLFASYVCSAMATRYYGNATFVMSMPVASAERIGLNPVATDYVRRAGLLYGWGLRLFLLVVPLVAGVVHPAALVPATAVLLVALWFFDQPAASSID